MALIITPGQFAHRAELYHQLAQLTAAGIGLMQALERLQRNPPSRAFREPLRRLKEHLEQGSTFAESLKASSGWLPDLDIAFFEAGERSGRLDNCFRVLAEYYRERARMLKMVVSQLIYPAVLLHAVVFVFAIVVPFAGSEFNASLNYLFLKAGFILLPFYVFTVFLIYALQGGHGEKWRALVESGLSCIPVLGKARLYLALSRLTLTLDAMLNAGVNVIQAWQLAANACGSPRLRRTVGSWLPQVEAGETPATLVSNHPIFPELFADFYRNGEVSGRLDESLQHLHRYYGEEGSRKLQNFAEWTPKILYCLVAAFIVYKIFQFYGGYVGQITNLAR